MIEVTDRVLGRHSEFDIVVSIKVENREVTGLEEVLQSSIGG